MGGCGFVERIICEVNFVVSIPGLLPTKIKFTILVHYETLRYLVTYMIKRVYSMNFVSIENWPRLELLGNGVKMCFDALNIFSDCWLTNGNGVKVFWKQMTANRFEIY